MDLEDEPLRQDHLRRDGLLREDVEYVRVLRYVVRRWVWILDTGS
jgi:hypothetical protein